MMMYWVLIGGMSLIGMFISGKLKSKFQKYAQVPVRSGMSGKEVAEAMLRHYGIHDVQVLQGKGFLSDHYNPAKKVINLSPQVYQGRSVAAAAVAAHECGHAVQHDTAYAWLQMRSALVPVVSVAARAQQWLLIAAFAFAGASNGLLLWLCIAAFGATALFSFVTLPVEFDASKRALVWLDETGVAEGAEFEGAKDALWWAAMTYVSAALSSLVMLVWLLLSLAGGRD
jgi:Zn-dependent membrane protease YugP